MLRPEEEAAAVAFWRYTLLSLDDCLYALRATMAHLTRSSLHRLLKRHGISPLPEVGADKPGKQTLKTCPIGFFHMDIAEVRTEEGELHLYVAIDRTSKDALASPAFGSLSFMQADRPTACAVDAVVDCHLELSAGRSPRGTTECAPVRNNNR